MKIDEKTFQAMPAELQALFHRCPNPGRDEVVGLFPVTSEERFPGKQTTASWKMSSKGKALAPERNMGDPGSAARFFYCAKASKKERGLDNKHPTVKPIALMEYLCKLTATPTGGIILDPFMGSGTTGIAALRCKRTFIGIDQSEEYVNLARKRIRVK